MIKATSPAAKSSPMHIEAMRAKDTNTSALMSKAVTRPMTASSTMGTPHRMMATQAASEGWEMKNAGDQGGRRQGEKQDVPLDTAPVQQGLQALHREPPSHI